MAITDPLNQEDELQPATGIVSSTMEPAAAEPTTPQVTEPVTAAAPVAPAAGEFKAPEIKPVATQVAPEQETVEGRLAALTEKGSKYTELARADAMREANTRGLINTTMAAGAGTEAAIRAALPIAQQDAQTYAETRLANKRAEDEFLRNRQSANLNIEVAAIDTQLKTKFETIMQDQRFSDESKTQVVGVMNDIIRDTQQQIATIGTTDRSAEQQAGAIKVLEQNRDAQLAVYEDLLGSFNDWEWGIDFTPETVESPPPPSPPPPVETIEEPSIRSLGPSTRRGRGEGD